MTLEKRLPIAQFGARNKDKTILAKSSSGGVFSELARYILGTGGVVIAAGWNGATRTVEHKCVENINNLEDLLGSKYVTSDMSKIYVPMQKYLSSGRNLLFVGTPCQVAAIGINYGSFDNLILCSIICHSNVSAELWCKYRNEIEHSYGAQIQSVSFRDKRNGWGYGKGTVVIEFNNGEQRIEESLHDNLYMRAFFSGMATRLSCTKCQFRFGRSCADLMMGDFWGVENVLPKLDCSQGISAVMIYSDKGASVFSKLELETFPVTYSQVVDKNPYIEQSPSVDWKKHIRFQNKFKIYPLKAALRYGKKGHKPVDIIYEISNILRNLFEKRN